MRQCKVMSYKKTNIFPLIRCQLSCHNDRCSQLSCSLSAHFIIFLSPAAFRYAHQQPAVCQRSSFITSSPKTHHEDECLWCCWALKHIFTANFVMRSQEQAYFYAHCWTSTKMYDTEHTAAWANQCRLPAFEVKMPSPDPEACLVNML